MNTDPTERDLLGDLFIVLMPKFARCIQKRYHALPSSFREELHQAGLTHMLEQHRLGKLRLEEPLSHWLNEGIWGATRYYKEDKRQRGRREGNRYLILLTYESELPEAAETEAFDNPPLEYVCAKVQTSAPYHTDPEGGACDRRIDVEWLTQKALHHLEPEAMPHAQVIVSKIREGYEMNEIRAALGLSAGPWRKALEDLRRAFYTAADRPFASHPQVDREEVLALYARGLSQAAIARRTGYSKSLVGVIVNQGVQS